MTVKLIDCADPASGYNYTPWAFACYGNKPLPNVLYADIGPVVIPTCDPNCACYNFPTSGSIRVSFERVTPCDWESGTIVWVCSAFGYPLTVFVNTYQKIFQQYANIPIIDSVFSFSGDPTPSGSCSYDESTGETTGQMTGIATIPPQGCSCDGCLLSYTVYFGTPP